MPELGFCRVCCAYAPLVAGLCAEDFREMESHDQMCQCTVCCPPERIQLTIDRMMEVVT